MKNIIITDFDGVIGDSLKLAMTITRKIVDLFDTTSEVLSFNDFYRLLGKKSELNNVTELESDTLRELYRIMHRHYSKEIKLFVEVLELYSNLSQKPIIVSSSYADVIKEVLGDYENNFECIYGYESGHKLDILRNLTGEYQFIYVTDTYRDIIICKSLGIPVIATCWGYDSLERMEVEKPDYIAKNYYELNSILTKLNFLK